jgi:hypothetical protein
VRDFDMTSASPSAFLGDIRLTPVEPCSRGARKL